MATEAHTPSMFERVCDFEGRMEFSVPVNRRAVVRALLLIALVTATTVITLQTGVLADFYKWLWTSTTGETYTDVARDRAWLYPTAAAVVIIPASFLLPRQYWVRVVLLYVTFWTGFVGGHVFWT